MKTKVRIKSQGHQLDVLNSLSKGSRYAVSFGGYASGKIIGWEPLSGALEYFRFVERQNRIKPTLTPDQGLSVNGYCEDEANSITPNNMVRTKPPLFPLPQTKCIDVCKAEQELKKCPKIVRDYVASLNSALQAKDELVSKQMAKIVQLSSQTTNEK